MMTLRTYRRNTGAADLQRGLDAEWIMAWLVLLTIALSVLGSATGHADVEGKAKNGIRRAASQLERKIVKVPIVQAWQGRTG